MIAVKTFDSTGIAPNGKLFAGDLNAIQAAAAAQTDLTQTIDLGTIRIGEAGLTLTRFGAGEAVLAGDMRVTKILRGLEGIIPGAFTTIQRNAIAVNRAPYGIAILNSDKNKWEWNIGTDAARNWQPFGIDSPIGLLSAIPAASSVPTGSRYWATDQAVEYISNGSAWLRVGIPSGSTVWWFSGSAPTGWVKYDGSNLPSSTGIYLDLAAHLGGVATPNTKGKVLVGQDTGDTDFDVIGEIRGTKTHTLGGTEMDHTHGTIQVTGNYSGSPAAAFPAVAGFSVGNGGALNTTPHNNIQPSIVGCYIAKL